MATKAENILRQGKEYELDAADYLGDPLNDRVMKDVKSIPHKKLSAARAFAQGQVNPKLIMKWLREGGTLSKNCLVSLIAWAKQRLETEPNILRVDGAVAIVGDIHGQFYDMLYMIDKMKTSKKGIEKLVFMGDYVDRGMYGPEVMCYLMAMKLERPKDIFLLRGNHETRYCTETYNFREQCVQQFDLDVYDRFMELFDNLPIAATVNGRYISIHGGIAQGLNTFQQINHVNRVCEPESDTLLSDLLWADPVPERHAQAVGYVANDERGTSVKFGLKPLQKLLKQENLDALIRAHQVKQTGYEFQCNDRQGNPNCITIFSAPNYGGRWRNDGAVFFTNQHNSQSILTFEEVQNKPVVLQIEDPQDPERMLERVDGINYCMDLLVGHTTQALLGMIMLGNDQLGKMIAATPSSDIEYLRKVAMESLKDEESKGGAASAQAKADAIVAKQQKNEAAMTNAQKQDRKLQELGDELGIGLGEEDDNIEEDLKSAAKFNSARTSSQLMIDGVDNRIKVRESIEGTDKAQPALIFAQRTLSDQLEVDIKSVSVQDPERERKIRNLYKAFQEKNFELSSKYDGEFDNRGKRKR